MFSMLSLSLSLSFLMILLQTLSVATTYLRQVLAKQLGS